MALCLNQNSLICLAHLLQWRLPSLKTCSLCLRQRSVKIVEGYPLDLCLLLWKCEVWYMFFWSREVKQWSKGLFYTLKLNRKTEVCFVHHSNNFMNTVSIFHHFKKLHNWLSTLYTKKLCFICDSCRWRQNYITYFAGKDQLVKDFLFSYQKTKTVQKKKFIRRYAIKSMLWVAQLHILRGVLGKLE